MLLFTRAIRKNASSMLSAASQLFLLMKWRSLRTFLQADFHASMKSAPRKVRVNWEGQIKKPPDLSESFLIRFELDHVGLKNFQYSINIGVFCMDV